MNPHPRLRLAMTLSAAVVAVGTFATTADANATPVAPAPVTAVDTVPVYTDPARGLAQIPTAPLPPSSPPGKVAPGHRFVTVTTGYDGPDTTVQQVPTSQADPTGAKVAPGAVPPATSSAVFDPTTYPYQIDPSYCWTVPLSQTGQIFGYELNRYAACIRRHTVGTEYNANNVVVGQISYDYVASFALATSSRTISWVVDYRNWYFYGTGSQFPNMLSAYGTQVGWQYVGNQTLPLSRQTFTVAVGLQNDHPLAQDGRIMWQNFIIAQQNALYFGGGWTPYNGLIGRNNHPEEVGLGWNARCDQSYGGVDGGTIFNTARACILGAIRPTFLISNTRYQAAAQTFLTATTLYGAPTTLTRIQTGRPGSAQADRNTYAANKVCALSGSRPAGQQCDEYPYARTQEGAASGPHFWAHWIPEKQNGDEGRDWGTRMGIDRVFPFIDPFTVGLTG